MDPINSLNQIMQVLRQRLSNKPAQAGKPATKSSTPTQHSQPAAKPGADEVLRRIGERIRALSLDEKRGPKAMQIFIESVLVWEFGEELLQDPRFTEIAKEVQSSISENARAKEKLVMLLNQL